MWERIINLFRLHLVILKCIKTTNAQNYGLIFIQRPKDFSSITTMHPILSKRQNNLRNQFSVLCLVVVILFCFVGAKSQSKPPRSKSKKILTGTASYYSQQFEGKKTANGEIFRQNKRTAACNKLPLGSYVRVTNLKNKKSVKVKINDRLHRKSSRLIDLSKSAASELGIMKQGLAKVRVETISAAEFRKKDAGKSTRKKAASRKRKKNQR